MKVIVLIAALSTFVLTGCPGPMGRCSSSIERTTNGIKFGGVEIPIGATSPVKIANFEYSPTAINEASDLVQLADQHRMAVCTNMQFMSQAARDEAGKEAIRDDTFLTSLALALSKGDATQVSGLINAEIDRWKAQTTPGTAVSPVVPPQASGAAQLPKLPPVPGRAAPSGAVVTPVDKATMTATLSYNMTAGSCTLYAGSSIRLVGATGYYTLITSTRRTTSGDIWWADWDGRDAQGNVLFSATRSRTNGEMWTPDQKVISTGTTPLSAGGGNNVYDIVWRGSC
jgi:hypothetical protein